VCRPVCIGPKRKSSSYDTPHAFADPVLDRAMIEGAIEAAGIILDPARLGFLSLGVIIGLIVGIIPGLGGLVGLSILLPFTYGLDPYAAIAMLLALSSVVATGDTIPAVLFGVPGTVGSAATVMDGYPMARQGQAGRAFGAAFSASLIGGLFGAALLFVSLPILQPLVLLVGPPELFGLCLLGISLVALLSGKNRITGLAAACLGLMLATVGDDPNTATPRWTFQTLYLFDGIPLVPLALGMFALPELAELTMHGGTIVQNRTTSKLNGQWQGIKDTFRNLRTVLQSALLGSGLGAIPGLGAAVIDWIAYGMAARTTRGSDESFGKGDVRGVIASESSNNAKEGGSLIPTIAFGVPGTASMAILLGAFQIHGIVPGQAMLTHNIDLTYSMIWSVALANVLGAGICFLFANQLARLALVPVGILVPCVLAMTLMGAFQTGASLQDIYALIFFGLVGMAMKLLGWSRPALVLGFVLGSLIERYLSISYSLDGPSFVFRPGVAALLSLIAIGIALPLATKMFHRPKAETPAPKRQFQITENTLFAAAIASVFAYALLTQSSWPFQARLMPSVFATAGLFISIVAVIQSLWVPVDLLQREALVSRYLSPTALRAMRFFSYCGLFALIVPIMGLLPTLLIMMVWMLRFEGRQSLVLSLVGAGTLLTFCYVLFHLFVHLPWPNAWIGDLFPVLRDWFPTDIV